MRKEIIILPLFLVSVLLIIPLVFAQSDFYNKGYRDGKMEAGIDSPYYNTQSLNDCIIHAKPLYDVDSSIYCQGYLKGYSDNVVNPYHN